MARIHVSKDPSNQLAITFASYPLNVKSRSGNSLDKREIIFLIENMHCFFIEALRNHSGCGFILKL